MAERKVYTLKNIKDSLENCLQSVPNAMIYLHNEKSYNNNTVFSTVIMPLDKALTIFGDCEVMYPQLAAYGEYNSACVKFGIVIED